MIPGPEDAPLAAFVIHPRGELSQIFIRQLVDYLFDFGQVCHAYNLRMTGNGIKSRKTRRSRVAAVAGDPASLVRDALGVGVDVHAPVFEKSCEREVEAFGEVHCQRRRRADSGDEGNRGDDCFLHDLVADPA